MVDGEHMIATVALRNSGDGRLKLKSRRPALPDRANMRAAGQPPGVGFVGRVVAASFGCRVERVSFLVCPRGGAAQDQTRGPGSGPPGGRSAVDPPLPAPQSGLAIALLRDVKKSGGSLRSSSDQFAANVGRRISSQIPSVQTLAVATAAAPTW
jgi:hypothetical protein